MSIRLNTSSSFLFCLELVMSNKTASENDYMKCIGMLAQNAAIADMTFFSVFCDLMGSTVKVARAIYYTLEAIPPKQKLVSRIAELKKDKALLKAVDKLGNFVKSAHAPRNDLAHSTLVQQNGVIQRHSQKYGTQIVTLDFLKGKINASGEALTKCRLEHERICQMLGTQQKLYC